MDIYNMTYEEAVRIRPLADRVLVQRITDPEEFSGLVWAPDVARGASTLCKVVAVGPGRLNKHGNINPCEVQPGSIVRIGPWTDWERGEFAFIQEGDIRLVYDESYIDA